MHCYVKDEAFEHTSLFVCNVKCIRNLCPGVLISLFSYIIFESLHNKNLNSINEKDQDVVVARRHGNYFLAAICT